MKKQILFACLVCFLFLKSTSSANGQTWISIVEAFDSSFTANCPAPFSTYFYIYGQDSGYTASDTLDIYFNFGDGQDTTVRQRAASPNYFQAGVSHTYVTAGYYSVEYIVSGPDGNADTVINYNQVIIGDTCGNITGVMYLDENTNCIYDAGDTPLPWRNVELLYNSNTIAWSSSDSLGNYYFDVPTGIPYTVRIVNDPSFSSVCPLSGNYLIATAPSSGNDFGLVCSQGFDLAGHVSAWGFRPGNTAYAYPGVINFRCLPVSGQAKLILDPLVTFVSSVPPPAAMSGDTLIWDFTNLSSNFYSYWWNSLISYVQLQTSVGAAIGDSICLTMIVEPVVNDSVPSNNIITHCFAVRNSWDPNDKTVSPAGEGPAGNISPTMNSPLTYTVRFQNTGNDSAYNVFIMDTLDSDLDIETFHVLSSSHPMEVDVYPGRAAKFSFNNIMLPDSATNQVESQGLVVYSIHQKAGLALGTQIQNTAAIYFDFNPAIRTNTTLNTIDDLSSSNNLDANKPLFSIAPNPVKSELMLIINNELTKKGNPKIRIYDMFGREVLNQAVHLLRNVTHYVLQVNELSSGVYVIRLDSDQGAHSVRMIKCE